MAVVASHRTGLGQLRLEDRYALPEGEVFLTGVQALVRMLLDAHRADLRAGLRTAILTSGYQGSPLGGLDRELAGLGRLAEEHDLVHRPGVNEELGATAVWGSQLANTLPKPRFDGVIGAWYGKAPGVDRAADALRHGNYMGSHPRGGMIALCGDDPEAKSSTLPSGSESLLAALQMPVLFPASVQETLDYGRHAIACSRASGLWAAMKVNTIVADATATAEVGPDRVTPVIPVLEWEGRPYVHQPSPQFLPPASYELERTLFGVRLQLARLYARENGLNQITAGTGCNGLGVIAAGPGHHQLIQAFENLGVEHRPRLLKLGMLYPLDVEIVREFADGLDQILVLEEKSPFIERLVKDALYGCSRRPEVIGKHDAAGRPLVPVAGVLDPDVIARAVGPLLLEREDLPLVRARLDQLDAIDRRPLTTAGQSRTPHFCSGCPHSFSTLVDDDVTVGAGIGCHTMVMLNSAGRGQVIGTTQMGGEGAQFIGIAPFVEARHFVQNIGDGTFHHSGSLAIRAAIAAGLNVTYKLLYNSAVAMTGGQQPVGQMSVGEIARSLEAEGVRRIVITTEDTRRYERVSLPAIAEVRERSGLLDAQRELAKVPGVTVLIHDQACANELRRERKRGTAPDPPYRLMINERVCEGCGDCGAKSACLSLEPVDTEFGRKTQIDQTSCNKDSSCVQGDCPSFMRVIPPEPSALRKTFPMPQVALPDPVPCVPEDDVRIRLVGIGGTGVVTVSQVLGMAALLGGHHAAGLDQTGLSQKAGPVVSDIRIAAAPLGGGVNGSAGATDVLLGLDILGSATARNLTIADPERTVAIVSTSLAPTVQMVVDVDAPRPDLTAAVEAIDAATRSADNVFIDARTLAVRVLGEATTANVVVLGAAWQRGAIPLSLETIRQAFTMNGVAVEANLAAFEWGRAVVAAPDLVDAVLRPEARAPSLSRRDRVLVDRIAPEDGELRRRVAIRIADLDGWGGIRSARRYAEQVAAVRELESRRLPGSTRVTEAYATGLHKLMAYKDEYEVARLQLQQLGSLPEGSRVTFLLHPPLLRSFGLQRKLALGPWFVPAFRLLRRMRRLRGTPLDPFGRAEVRRVERQLPGEYAQLVTQALAAATPESAGAVLALAELPDLVRGYEDIKLRNVERFRVAAAALLSEL